MAEYRTGPLLRLLNNDRMSPAQVRAALRAFLQPWARTESPVGPMDWSEVSDAELADARKALVRFLSPSAPVLHLRLDLGLMHPLGLGHRTLAQRKRARYAVITGGSLRDLVLYRMARVFESGAFQLVRCPAPAPGDWSRRCARWLVSGGQRGRPARFCSEACRVRDQHANESAALRTSKS